MGKYRGRIWSSVGRRLENECTSSDPGIVSYGIVPCDGHLLYAGTQVRQREICAFKLPVCGQLCLYGRVHIYGKRHNRDVLIYDGCGMPVLFFCIVSKECLPKKSFLFLTYFGLFSIIDNSLKLMVTMLLPHLTALAGYYLVNVLRTAALLLILALYKKYAAPVIQSLADIKKGRWWNLALIALLFYLLQAAITIFLYVKNVIPATYLLFLFIMVSLVMCAVYAVVFSNVSYMKKDAEAELIRQNAEYFSNRLSVLQNAEETNRRLRHDMRHHIDTIATYAKTGDNAAILAYIGEYGNEISEAAVKRYSVNRTVDSILSVYVGKAEENGIGFSVSCNVPKELNMREIDIIALLGNLLENALNGCLESGKESKSIEIRIRLQKKILIILCNNTCSDDFELADGLPAKKSIGVFSILSVCRKYDGNLDYRIENETCSASVVLNL